MLRFISGTLVSVLLLSPAALFSALAFDAAVEGGGWSGGAATSFVFSHTVTGSNRILFVCTANGSNTTDRITGVTYAGTPMTQLLNVSNTVNERYYMYYLINPATGANNVTITASTGGFINGIAASYTDAHQTTQPDSSGSNFSSTNVSTLTVSTTVVDSTSWAVGCSVQDGRPQLAGTGVVSERAFEASNKYWSLGDSNGTVPAGTYSMTWNTNGGTGRFIQLLASIKDVGSGGGGAAPAFTNVILFE